MAKKTVLKDKKQADLDRDLETGMDQFLTTDQGLRISDNQNSLKAGERGATLLEDFILREKITHFDHERIPERVVHPRGVGAHGVFELYESLSKYTKAGFLTDVGRKTPVFARFSTVAGSKGSTDLARDVRGFAVKFYTDEGNYDLVGNNIPVFFIQDAIKFPDLIHAVKPEPHNEIPQAASAHDTFWDFVSLMSESTHMLMWVMSDRAIPRSLRMMEGFGVHTFRFINEAGKSTFVKFHWKPLLGVHSVAWDEATRISGKDPDFHRRDLSEAIDAGAFPEWELGVQLVPEKDEHKFDFDLLDPTKLIPEELVPVLRVGKMTLDRNPANYFAETEQVAFHPGHLVPGIDFSNDPLLQGRLFSYTDTQLSRLGSPNFHELPINRSVAPVHNNQRDAQMRHAINDGQVAYEPNTLAGGCPYQAGMKDGGFHSYDERIDANKVRGRSKSFFDHFSQATLFFNSQTDYEKTHIVNAFSFELGKVQTEAIRLRMLGNLTQVDRSLAKRVADNLGVSVPKPDALINQSIPADTNPRAYQPIKSGSEIEYSKPLSMADTIKDSIVSRRIAILASDGVDSETLKAMSSALIKAGAMVNVIAPHLGVIASKGRTEIKADEALFLTSSVLFDAVFIAGGDALADDAEAVFFVNEAFKHCKAIASGPDGIALLERTFASSDTDGVITGKSAKSLIGNFISAIAFHRFWSREELGKVAA